MELEKWLEKYNIKKMVQKNCKFYLNQYKEEDEEDFNESFKDIDWQEVSYEFHSVSYVINTWHGEEDDLYKYISAKVRLEYDNTTFAEYEAIYDFQGNLENDYLRYC